jgi:hypothetical protein
MDHSRTVTGQILDMQTNAMEQESFLTSLKSISCLNVSMFVETHGLLFCSQKPATGW